MVIDSTPSRPVGQKTTTNWHNFYCLLFPIVTGWVLSARIPIWFPQRDEIIAEIVQEAITRTFARIVKGYQGDFPPVESPERLSITIAHNYYIDMIRRDTRFVHIVHDGQEDTLYKVHVTMQDTVDALEVANEKVYVSSLFKILVSEILRFSPKLRTALLIDLASRMSFIGEPTLLQQAFLSAGVNLQDHRLQVPSDPVLRSRHASLVSLAYKKISQLTSVQEYIKSA